MGAQHAELPEMSSTREEYVLSRVSQSLFDASETVRLYLTEAQTPLPGFEQLYSLLMQADIQRKLLAFRDFKRINHQERQL